MSPFPATAICRAVPIPSATTSAQKPAGTVIPPLSESQAGALAAGRLQAIANRKAAARATALFFIRIRDPRELWLLLCLFCMTLYRIQDTTTPVDRLSRICPKELLWNVPDDLG